ncbi:hypothetical protein J2Z40_003523 [Cytobacillus eiseniae]|uniref:DUF4275 domain-containing protein n=1 Tax=Cytobacillus eiseniae TaxID=762947 RepID=A0ABS4RJ60_9BACI|nr:DUF4275 family protein [Cytobacillus eiseniae]MBP2242941.1 hypothetical protein [Cytobacillus eiseniae]
MDLETRFKKKKIKYTHIPNCGTDLRKQWEAHFSNHLSDKEKESIFLYDKDGYCGYLWHLFSFNKRSSLEMEQADCAFNNEAKQFCYVFYQHTNDGWILENASSLHAEDFLNEEDVYVVDKAFTWTYVRTHETGWCGPYFSRKDM